MPTDLTDEQKAVVEHRGTPLRVVAGPGTGKTTSVVVRIGDLILKDKLVVHPSKTGQVVSV